MMVSVIHPVQSGIKRIVNTPFQPPASIPVEPQDLATVTDAPPPPKHTGFWTSLMMACAVGGPLAVGLMQSAVAQPAVVTATMREPLVQRYQTLQKDLAAEQQHVAAGHETGAQALRHVLVDAAQMSETPAQFMQLTQSVFVANAWIPHGVIADSTLPQPPAGDFHGLPTTGWKTEYKDATNGVVNDQDQSHHLVAFMALGFEHGRAAADAGSAVHKIQEGQLANAGDLRLGIVAGQFGAQLGNSTFLDPLTGNQHENLVNAVNQFCDQIELPVQPPASPITWSLPAKP